MYAAGGLVFALENWEKYPTQEWASTVASWIESYEHWVERGRTLN